MQRTRPCSGWLVKLRLGQLYVQARRRNAPCPVPLRRTSMTELPATIWPSWACAAAFTFLRRWMVRSRSRRSLRKRSLENSQRSGSAFLKPCVTNHVLSCRHREQGVMRLQR